MMLKVPYFKQNREFTCGPACLRMVLAYFGIQQDEVTLTMQCRTDVFGTYPSEIVRVAKQLKLSATGQRDALWQNVEKNIASNIPIICIVDPGILNQTGKKGNLHMVVLVGIDDTAVVLHDPQEGAQPCDSNDSIQRSMASDKAGGDSNMAQEKVSIYERIRQRIVVYLIEHVGDMAVQGHPQFDKELERWRVPIYCRTYRGTLLGGEIQLTKRLRITFVTPRQEMVRNVEAQLKQLKKVRLPNLPASFFSAAR